MKRLISLVVSIAILAVIYWRIDFSGLLGAFKNSDPFWMAVSMLMIVPLTLFTSWRLQQLMPHKGQLGFGEANKLILLASVLNLILPSKMGDIAKSYFMRNKGGLTGSLAFSMVVFEKVCDMLSLLLWCVFGLLMYREKDALFWTMTAGVGASLVASVLLLASTSFANFFFNTALRFAPGKAAGKLEKLQSAWVEMHRYFWASKRQLAKIAITSIFVWYLHLLQIWMFVLALKGSVPILENLALAPLALLAGLLPLGFAGVGTRDAALIYFYGPYTGKEVAAALGVLCTSRYLLPAIGGLPFLKGYYKVMAEARKKDKDEALLGVE